MKKEKPNPGSQGAIDKGCTCPVIDNHYGKGIPMGDEPMFWISGDCKLHSINEKTRKNNKKRTE